MPRWVLCCGLQGQRRLENFSKRADQGKEGENGNGKDVDGNFFNSDFCEVRGQRGRMLASCFSTLTHTNYIGQVDRIIARRLLPEFAVESQANEESVVSEGHRQADEANPDPSRLERARMEAEWDKEAAAGRVASAAAALEARKEEEALENRDQHEYSQAEIAEFDFMRDVAEARRVHEEAVQQAIKKGIRGARVFLCSGF